VLLRWEVGCMGLYTTQACVTVGSKCETCKLAHPTEHLASAHKQEGDWGPQAADWWVWHCMG
jgi:hypothetical protein